MDVLDAIDARRACRAFLDKPVDKKIVQSIIAAAMRSPSNKNTQPWHIAALTGDTKRQLGDALISLDQAGEPINPDFSHIEKSMGEPYWRRARACGAALYEALDIQRDDHERRQAQWQSNYRFFDAPVGLIFYLDKRFSEASFFDVGIFISHLTLAAQAYGIATCPQMSIGNYPDAVRQVLNLSENDGIVCGMALGFADNTQPINQYRTMREEVDTCLDWFV